MTQLAVLRHGPTEWNAAGRIQGHTDTPLSPAGRARVAAWRLPAELRGLALVSSPLARAVETARLIAGEPALEARLTEMGWGEWEGRTLADLRAERGADMAAMEARGLDFQPPGGESPRQVQTRLAPWLAATAAAGQDMLAVTHKGVIRALYAQAAGWDMMARPAHRLDWASVHLFHLDPDGVPHIDRLNLSLES